MTEQSMLKGPRTEPTPKEKHILQKGQTCICCERWSPPGSEFAWLFKPNRNLEKDERDYLVHVKCWYDSYYYWHKYGWIPPYRPMDEVEHMEKETVDLSSADHTWTSVSSTPVSYFRAMHEYLTERVLVVDLYSIEYIAVIGDHSLVHLNSGKAIEVRETSDEIVAELQ